MSKFNEYLESVKLGIKSNKKSSLNSYIDALKDSLQEAFDSGEDPESEYDRIYRDLRDEFNVVENDELYDAEDKMLTKFRKINGIK